MTHHEHPLSNELINLFHLKKHGDHYVRTIYNKEVVITNFDSTIQLLDDITVDDLTIYYSNNDSHYAEVITLEELNKFRNNQDERLNDTTNDREYHLSEPSDYYIIWLFETLLKQSDRATLNRLKMRFTNRLRIYLRNQLEGEYTTLTLVDFLKLFIYNKTLTIQMDTYNEELANDLIESYHYTYMLNVGKPIKIYDLKEVFPFLSRLSQQQERTIYDTPKRRYNSILIDYYNLSLSTNDPFVAFISYYHIIEYFFGEVFKERQINLIKEKITSPRFSYQNDENIYALAQDVIKLNRQVREDGGGNELQTLKFVLEKYIHERTDLTEELSDDDIHYYENNKVTFSDGPKINVNEPLTKTIGRIANRIYRTRNSLVHSKSTRIDLMYHPYEHKELLTKEIPLIKTIAEIIIEKSSEII